MSDIRSQRFIRSYLKTRHLVLLTELGRHGSILHAAKSINMTQPAASRMLVELEHSLGVPLFERKQRGVEPTLYGNVLIRRAGAALSEMDTAHQEVLELQSGLRGRVALGAILTPSTTLIPRVIKLLQARNAHLNVSVDVDCSNTLLERLRSGELDIVVGRVGDAVGTANVCFEPITDEPHKLIVRKGHPLLDAPELSLHELASCTWIVPPVGSTLRDRITALFVSMGLELPAEIETPMAIPVVTSLLMNTDMVAPMPLELVTPYLENGLLASLPLDLDLRMDAYGIITRRNHQLSPSAEIMLETLREAAIRKADSRRCSGCG